MKKILAILLVSVFSFSSYSVPGDIHGKGDKYIKVTFNEDKTAAKFDLYSKKSNSKIRGLGEDGKYYSITELEHLRDAEKLDVALTGVLSVVILAAGAGGGVISYMLIVGGLEAASSLSMAYFYLGATIGGALGTKLISFFDRINPIEQYQQVKILSDKYISEQDVQTNADIDKMAKRFDFVLGKL